jgi:hypothetical protein
MPPIDFSQIFMAFVPEDLISAVFVVALGLGSLYTVCFGVLVVLVTFRGGSIQDQLRYLMQLVENSEFEDRWRRDAKGRRYQEWKKKKRGWK